MVVLTDYHPEQKGTFSCALLATSIQNGEWLEFQGVDFLESNREHDNEWNGERTPVTGRYDS